MSRERLRSTTETGKANALGRGRTLSSRRGDSSGVGRDVVREALRRARGHVGGGSASSDCIERRRGRFGSGGTDGVFTTSSKDMGGSSEESGSVRRDPRKRAEPGSHIRSRRSVGELPLPSSCCSAGDGAGAAPADTRLRPPAFLRGDAGGAGTREVAWEMAVMAGRGEQHSVSM